MARRQILLPEIRDKFTKLIDEAGKYQPVSNWLPSIGGDFQNTFTLTGSNPIGGGSSKGEINKITNFNQQDPNDVNLLRYMLFFYCTQQEPYFFDGSSQLPTDDILMNVNVETFLKNYQIGNGSSSKQSRSLTADIVRTYRGTKLKGNIDNEKGSIGSLIDYARSSKDYQTNVAGVLGKVTYDSIVKHRLYRDLLESGYIPNLSLAGTKPSELAERLEPGNFGIYIDDAGGPYSRAFPIICVYTKDVSGKKIGDLLQKSNEIVESKFFRKPNGDKQLVTPLPNGGEKNFLESTIRTTGYSCYFIVYDFAKVITLEPNVKNDYTLGILKIGLSVLSKIQSVELTLNEFNTAFQSSALVLEQSYDEGVENLFFKILFQTKHLKENSYILDKNQSSLKPKISKTFKVEVINLAKTLVSVGSKIINIFKTEIDNNFQFKKYSKEQKDQLKIILHFDGFYNLLAVTTYNSNPIKPTTQINDKSPFVLEDYKVEFSTGDIIAKFFDNSNTLPNFANGEYSFSPDFALKQDIVFITDFLIKQIYVNLDDAPGFVYESKNNTLKDDVLTVNGFNLLNLINSRLNIKLDKNDYFFISSNKIFLKKEVVRKLNLNELTFLFEETGEEKIKLQTIGYLLRNKLPTSDILKLTIDDLKEVVHYPILQEVSPSPEEKEEVPKTNPPTPPKNPPKNNNYLINNIITSQAACYEDIANTFEEALQEEDPWQILKKVAQTIGYIGLPILLAYSAEAIANQLKKISKKPNKDALDCFLSDTENLKKMIVGPIDAIGTNNNLFLQFVPRIIELPQIPFFPVFDLEKELKRRLLIFVVKKFTEQMSERVKKSLQAMLDMCNADSYLTAFLNAAIPNLSSQDKLGTPNSAGLPSGGTSTYIPEITTNINSLIDQSNIETKENVYTFFRSNFFLNNVDYPNNEISDFFDFLSLDLDAGEILVLLKGKSTPVIRSIVLTFVKGYKVKNSAKPDKFSVLFESEQDIAFLFIFLSQYINYRILMEQIAESLVNYVPNLCVNIDSSFEDYSLQFGEDQANAKSIELENELNDVCELKKKNDPFNLYASGPTLLTITLDNSLKLGFNSSVDSIENSLNIAKNSVSNFLNIGDVGPNNTILKKSASIPNIYISDFINQLASYYFIQGEKDEYLFKSPPSKQKYYNLFLTDSLEGAFLINKELFLEQVEKNIKDNFKIRKENYKKIFNQQLKSSGNIGLKTDTNTFNGYITRYNELKGKKIY